MLSISSSPSVSWPGSSSAPGSAIVPVSPVQPVKPVQAGQGSSRDAQTGAGPARDRPATAALPGTRGAAAGGQASAPEAAPLLPRERPNKGDGSPDRADLEAVEAEQQEQAQAQAEEASRKLQLQDVLSTVWKASAAVVDQALGEGDAVAQVSRTAAGSSDSANPVARGRAATGASRLASESVQMDLPFVPPARAEAGMILDLPIAVDAPVAYDEHGHASHVPLEAGSLISERV